MEKKKLIRAAIAGLAGAAVIGAGIFFATHEFIDRAVFPRNAQVIDLTDHELTLESYLDICAQHPNAQILWTVPFQGSRYPMDTESITVTALTEADVQVLDHLPNLKVVDGTHCADYAALVYLQAHRPDCQVIYEVNVGGSLYGSSTEALTVPNATAAELELVLPLLPQLRSLTLEGSLPGPEALLQLQQNFPGVEMHFSLNMAGQQVSSDATALDLSGAEVTQQELLQLLPLLKKLEEVNLADTALTDEELKELITRFPEIFFLCTLDFAGIPASTDSTEIDISGCTITVAETEEVIPYFPRLEKLIMSHCGIDDEAMDALNQRYPDISIVWTLQIGLATVRTDDTIFYPARIDEYDLPSNEELQKLRFCTEMIAIDIGHSKATDCEWVRYMPHLKFLILADTQITDLSPLSTAKELIYLELFTMNLTDYSPLLGCTALQDLNIGSTYADPEPLTQMTWLHNLVWHGVLKDPVLAEKALLLPEQLPDTNVVLETWRNIGGIWRFIPNYYVFRELLDADFFNQEYVEVFLDRKDYQRILPCGKNDSVFVGDVLAEIVRYRIDNGLPIMGIKNIGSEKAEILYQTLCDSRSWYDQGR